MSMNECVQKILSKKLSKGEKPSKQDLAIAHSECNKEKEAKLKTAKRLKIAKLNLHTKLLSAKLRSIKIGKLLEAKKKQ